MGEQTCHGIVLRRSREPLARNASLLVSVGRKMTAPRALTLGGVAGLLVGSWLVLARGRGTQREEAPVASMSIACSAPTHRISPLIYGIAYYPLTDAKDAFVWSLHPGARRWGGNHTSRYNWRLGNAWNTGADWFFRNVNYTGRADFSWRDFFNANHGHGVPAALTVPIIGWVAKDTHSWSFPVSVYGAQQSVDPDHPDAGNGMDVRGHPLLPGPTSRTSVTMLPKDAEAWVRAIRRFDDEHGERSVALYLLGNEPMLWSSTHRDVHPQPVGYDELLERTIAYGKALRRADPKAVIGGPCVWGWPAYFYSAIDAKAGFRRAPDRKKHGDVPLLAWYLRELAAYERRTGVKLIDALDVHFYPEDIPKGAVDPASRARRLRATRALWDPAYVDESWIGEPVQLLPRLTRLIAENYPGLGIIVGEYNFGGEGDISGGLAVAEALGRFSQAPKLRAAFYWTYPPQHSAAYQGFRAFRNFDDHGSGFQPLALRTTAPAGTSLFASRSDAGERLVAVLLNLGATQSRAARVHLLGCATSGVVGYRYGEGDAELAKLPASAVLREEGLLRLELPPYSITVLDVRLASTR